MQENHRWHEDCSSMHIASVGRVLMSFISLKVSLKHTHDTLFTSASFNTLRTGEADLRF